MELKYKERKRDAQKRKQLPPPFSQAHTQGEVANNSDFEFTGSLLPGSPMSESVKEDCRE